MNTNETPRYDPSDNPTGCCPRFHPESWEGQRLHFDRKPFVRASTISAFHVPLNMGSVFGRTWRAIQQAHADSGAMLVLSHDQSAWHSEHLFAVSAPVPGAEMTYLSGDFLTKVFEGPFELAPEWSQEMARWAATQGCSVETQYFFYTTCPKCAKYYGRNYVVGVAKVQPARAA